VYSGRAEKLLDENSEFKKDIKLALPSYNNNVEIKSDKSMQVLTFRRARDIGHGLATRLMNRFASDVDTLVRTRAEAENEQWWLDFKFATGSAGMVFGVVPGAVGVTATLVGVAGIITANTANAVGADDAAARDEYLDATISEVAMEVLGEVAAPVVLKGLGKGAQALYKLGHHFASRPDTPMGRIFSGVSKKISDQASNLKSQIKFDENGATTALVNGKREFVRERLDGIWEVYHPDLPQHGGSAVIVRDGALDYAIDKRWSVPWTESLVSAQPNAKNILEVDGKQYVVRNGEPYLAQPDRVYGPDGIMRLIDPGDPGMPDRVRVGNNRGSPPVSSRGPEWDYTPVGLRGGGEYNEVLLGLGLKIKNKDVAGVVTMGGELVYVTNKHLNEMFIKNKSQFSLIGLGTTTDLKTAILRDVPEVQLVEGAPDSIRRFVIQVDVSGHGRQKFEMDVKKQSHAIISVSHAGAAADPFWNGRGSRGFEAKNGQLHWDKHRSEFSPWTSEEYFQAAKNLVTNPPEEALIKYQSPSASKYRTDTYFYVRSSNTFAVLAQNGQVITMFKPDHGQHYFDKIKGDLVDRARFLGDDARFSRGRPQ
jgi:hypothetical protein